MSSHQGADKAKSGSVDPCGVLYDLYMKCVDSKGGHLKMNDCEDEAEKYKECRKATRSAKRATSTTTTIK
eukprot:ANDGO_02658.mRNA.1 hypothetical protein